MAKYFGSFAAVEEVNLDVSENQLVTLLGPSGCGKTTTLRMIAGFEFPTRGQISIAGKDVTFVPPNKREIGIVFQSYSLFPHLRVADNVAYGLNAAAFPRRSAPSAYARLWNSSICYSSSTAIRPSCRADSSSASRWHARS